MTHSKLSQLLSSGCGQGRDDLYQPWIRVRRKLSSPVSNLFSLPNPLHARALQLLSGLELQAANVALWLGCSEIREQRPAWPWEHDHPATGRDHQRDDRMPKVRGLLEIAKDAGIDHGSYPGTRIPFVATVDFTLTVGARGSRLVNWSCKPRELLDHAPARARMLERLELERRYSRESGALHVVIDGTQFSPVLAANLDWLRPLRSELRRTLAPDLLSRYAETLMSFSDAPCLGAAKAATAARLGLSDRLAESYFRAGAWLSLIDIDLAKPVVWSMPLQLDGSCLKDRLARELLGALDGH